jgi:hypothetical protein
MGNNDIHAEFRVMVERVGEHSKGKKFYAGFFDPVAAFECSHRMNESAKLEHSDGRPLFEYTVEKRET